MQVDFLIIGQGLAGSLLGWELFRRQQKICIVDNGEENASQIAAGLINPVTGMRFVKSPQTTPQLEFAEHFYQLLADHFNQPFWFAKPMLRLLSTSQEYQQAQKRLSNPDYAAYLEAIIPGKDGIVSPQGILLQKKTAFLKTRPLLNGLRQFFQQNNCLQESTLDYQDIILASLPKWRHISARKIIFCQGYLNRDNPWFNYLPLIPVKGEILTGQSPLPLINAMLNYGHWFIPQNDYLFKTGASFERNNDTTHTTAEAKNSLLNTLQHVYPATRQARIIRQQAGIRPTTEDRQPFIGPHPEYSQLYIFNGFGAKGSLQIPYYARQLARHLTQNLDIDSNCHIKRYEHRFTAA